MTCRICMAPTREILDLGVSPPANSLKRAPDEEQESYPLVLEWCSSCGNVQLRDALPAEVLYRDYLYTTPHSSSLEEHYETLAAYLLRNGLMSAESSVVEVGSNVGHFLRHLADRVSRVLGVDPAREIADKANRSGVPTIPEFFDREVARRILDDRGDVDLVVARHCLAHNASPHEMLAGASMVLADNGHLLIENAYVVNTIENAEFDQIYHEHMFYFSLTSMSALLRRHGMRVVDLFLTPVHGGSIVFIAARGSDGPVSRVVEECRAAEASVLTEEAFARFARRSEAIRHDLAALVQELRQQDRLIYSYGATAKGNTLLNATGITHDQIPRCVDSTPLKQGRFLPGSNIEVIPEGSSEYPRPDFYLLTAWNYLDEIVGKVRASGNHTTKFIVPIPSVRVV